MIKHPKFMKTWLKQPSASKAWTRGGSAYPERGNLPAEMLQEVTSQKNKSARSTQP